MMFLCLTQLPNLSLMVTKKEKLDSISLSVMEEFYEIEFNLTWLVVGFYD
jgi:hypothetical protein